MQSLKSNYDSNEISTTTYPNPHPSKLVCPNFLPQPSSPSPYLSASALLVGEQRRDGLGQPLLVEVAAGEDEERVEEVDEHVLAHARVPVLEVGQEEEAEERKRDSTPEAERN